MYWEILLLTTRLAYLRLHGVDAKQHPVFRELTRVRQYFTKIKDLETEPEQRSMTLDKEAAGRFIKHGLVSTKLVQMNMIVANGFHSLAMISSTWNGQRSRPRKEHKLNLRLHNLLGRVLQPPHNPMTRPTVMHPRERPMKQQPNLRRRFTRRRTINQTRARWNGRAIRQTELKRKRSADKRRRWPAKLERLNECFQTTMTGQCTMRCACLHDSRYPSAMEIALCSNKLHVMTFT